MLNVANNSVELMLAGLTRKTVMVPSLDATVLDLKAEIAKSNGTVSKIVHRRHSMIPCDEIGSGCRVDL